MVLRTNYQTAKVCLDEKAGVAFVQYGENLNLEEGKNAAQRASELPGLKPGFGTFVDFRNCVEISMTAEEIRELNIYINSIMDWRGSYPTAHLLPTKLLLGLSRMSAATYGPDSNQVGSFDELGPALEWIGLPSDYQLPF